MTQFTLYLDALADVDFPLAGIETVEDLAQFCGDRRMRLFAALAAAHFRKGVLGDVIERVIAVEEIVVSVGVVNRRHAVHQRGRQIGPFFAVGGGRGNCFHRLQMTAVLFKWRTIRITRQRSRDRYTVIGIAGIAVSILCRTFQQVLLPLRISTGHR